MPTGGFTIINEHGQEIFVTYDELDSDVIESMLRPIGGFCYDASEFLQLNLPEAPYFIKDWLPMRGKLEIYAPPKSGKSFLSVQLARCIASQEPFLGMPTRRGTVLYIQSELGEEILQQRMGMTGQDYDGVYVGTTFSMKLDTKGGQSMLNRAVDAVKPDVLILDPLYKMMNGDENETQDMVEIVNYLDSIIEAHKCSIVVIHHTGKDIDRGGRGSNSLEAWVDSCIQMKRMANEGDALRVKFKPQLLRHASLPPEAIEIEMVDFEFQVVDARKTIKQNVREYLEKCNGIVVSPALIMQAVEGGRKSIHNALNELVNEGVVEHGVKGQYRWKGGG